MDIYEVEEIILNWPGERMRELTLLGFYWTFYACDSCGLREKIIGDLKEYQNFMSLKQLLVMWLKQSFNSKAEIAFGCFLPEGHENYFNIETYLPLIAIKRGPKAADDGYNDYLNSILKK